MKDDNLPQRPENETPATGDSFDRDTSLPPEPPPDDSSGQTPAPPVDGEDSEGIAGEGEAAGPSEVDPKRKRKTILLNVLLAICICGMVVAIIMLVTIFSRYKVASDEYKGLQESYATSEAGPRYIDLAALRAINPECIGWIEIPGTDIDYPLLHTTDNVKYLEVTFGGTWNPSGAIYLDAENTADFAMLNSLIYGHHMKDGSMFAGLASFMREDYRKAHDEVLIYTDDGIRHYEVFAARQVAETDLPMSIWFDDEAAEEAFRQEIGGSAVTLEREDHIITLVTCVNSYDASDQRYIVQAVLRSIEPMPDPPADSSSAAGASAASGSNAG